jgi:hypothetical protein
MGLLIKLKLWEIALVLIVCLMAALVYETHTAPGRYIQTDTDGGPPLYLLDTATGKAYKYSDGEWMLKRPAVSNRSHSIPD